MKKEQQARIHIHETFSYGIIYVYSIPTDTHRGRLKIGSATVKELNPTQEYIEQAAHERIQQQTKTADIPYRLEHAERAVTNDGRYFSDRQVHEVLKRSNYDRKSENVNNTRSEWFEINIEVAKKAIQAVKEGRAARSTSERKSSAVTPIQFRPNQRLAMRRYWLLCG